MSFDLFPSQTAPESIGAGMSSGFVTFSEHIGPDNADILAIGAATVERAATGLPNAMFIRIAKWGLLCGLPGGGAPTVNLRADGGPIATMVADNGVNIDNGADTVGTGILDDLGNGIYSIKVILFHVGSTWEIEIQNADGVQHDFVWVVASSDADASQPWLDVADTLEITALTNQSVPQTLQLSNRGTGELVINDAPATVLGSGFTLTNVPGGAILPNNCDTIDVTFDAPAVAGSSNELYVINSNDGAATNGDPTSEHNGAVALSAETGQLEIMMALDGSGSMSWRPDGSPTVSPTESRWSHLSSAASAFLNLLGDFGGGSGRFGVTIFPDIINGIPAGPSSAHITAATDIDGAAISAAEADIDMQLPTGRTPMGHGIGNAIGTTAPAFGQFNSDNDSRSFNRRWLVLMSDGEHNHGPPEALDFVAGGSLPTFSDKDVRVFSVGYGDPGSRDVDHATLNTIAADSGGQFEDAGPNDAVAVSTLRKALLNALVTGLALNPVADPPGTLNGTGDENRHRVEVLPYDKRVSFMVSWGTFDRSRVLLQLLTPNCELITPEVAAQDRRIAFHSNPRYMMYTISPEFLHDLEQPQDGTWTLIVTGTGLGPDEQEQYEWDVIADSRLKLDLALDQSTYFAGDSINLTANLALDGLGISNAAVNVHLTRPGQAVDNWLAANRVTDRELKAAQELIPSNDHGIYQLKAAALRQKGLRFNLRAQQNTISMAETKAGMYETRIGGTRTPGTYTLYVVAVGTTATGTPFRREKRVQVRVDVRPDPDHTLVDIVYLPIDDSDFLRAAVTVIPRDRFGNVVLFDPTRNPQLQLSVDGGELLQGLSAKLDGSYFQEVRLPLDNQHKIDVAFRNQPLIPSLPLPEIGRLHYADTIVEHKLGIEGEKGVNEHADPASLLKTIVNKPSELFTALGGRGSVVVGVREQMILPADGDEITVFVQAQATRRAYKVEGLISSNDEKWVLIGESAGVTQSFTLEQAVEAVRIVDQSGQTYGADLKPDRAPGVGLRGVGFKHVGPKSKPKRLRTLTITGRIVSEETGEPLAGLQVNAYDQDLLSSDRLGIAKTNRDGRFRIDYTESDFSTFFDTKPDVFFLVYAEQRLVLNTQRSVHWNVAENEHFELTISSKRFSR